MKAMHSATIMIVDNRPSFRALIRQTLSQDNSLNAKIIECEPGEDGENAVAQIADNSPGLVLLDIAYPALKGLNLCKKIAQHFPKIGLITLSTNPKENDDELFEVIKSGATAYIKSKQPSSTELIAIIKQVSSGEYPICDNVARRPQVAWRVLRLFQDIARNRTARENYISLTPEETKTLALIAEGNQTKRIAGALGISELTVKYRLRDILNKLLENEKVRDLFTETQNSLLSYRIARDGNLFIFGALPSSSCQTRLLLDGPRRK